MPSIALVGINGRLGSRVSEMCRAKGWTVMDARRDGEARHAEIVFEAAAPEATAFTADLAGKLGVPAIFATSGRNDEHDNIIRHAALKHPVLVATNLSLGAHLLFTTAKQFALLKDAVISAQISERHPAYKRDAPSGTAKRLKEILHAGQIGYSRTGPPVSDHTASIRLVGEELSISLAALDLDGASLGAVRSILWIQKVKSPGIYSISDMYDEMIGGNQHDVE